MANPGFEIKRAAKKYIDGEIDLAEYKSRVQETVDQSENYSWWTATTAVDEERHSSIYSQDEEMKMVCPLIELFQDQGELARVLGQDIIDKCNDSAGNWD